MQIRDFIKELNVDIEVVQNKNYPSMVHLKYKGIDVCAAPNEIHDNVNPNYQNEAGDMHPNKAVVENKIKMFIDKFENDKEFRELMTEPL
jgi:hypothetical protein